MAGTPVSRRVAYFSSLYPALSQAFVDREVDALRSLGWEVTTFAVHPLSEPERRLEYLRSRAASTPAVRAGGPLRLLRTVVAFGLSHPRLLLRGLLRALRTGAPRARWRLWQLFYLVEGVALLALLDRHALRHVHVHFANNAADIARAAVALGNDRDGVGWSWSLAMHGPTEFEDPVGYDLAAKVASASFVACISEYCRTELARLASPEDARKLHVVRMSADTAAYRPGALPPGSADSRACGDGPAGLRVLYVGRLVREKAPSALVAAASRLREAGVDVNVDIVGRGPLGGDLARAVVRHGVADRVRLVGALGQDELPAVYRRADVFCLPSHSEGLPVVLMEAMASGLPVVTTRIAGVPELVVDGVTGLLVPPGSVAALTDALARLAGDPALRSSLAAAGRRRVVDEFDPVRQATRLAALLPAGTATTATPSRDRRVDLSAQERAEGASPAFSGDGSGRTEV